MEGQKNRQIKHAGAEEGSYDSKAARGGREGPEMGPAPCWLGWGNFKQMELVCLYGSVHYFSLTRSHGQSFFHPAEIAKIY